MASVELAAMTSLALDELPERQCRVCGEVKSPGAFRRSGRGLCKVCRDCEAAARASRLATWAVCTVDGCGKRAQSLNGELCTGHYARKRRHGDVGDRPLRIKGVRVVCEVDGCTATAGFYTRLCAKHETRVRRHGDPRVCKPRPVMRGSDNPAWTGEDASYTAIHQRVRKARGSASDHECVACGAPARHWAYDHGDPDERTAFVPNSPNPIPYSVHVTHYQPMCVPCHKRMDLARF